MIKIIVKDDTKSPKTIMMSSEKSFGLTADWTTTPNFRKEKLDLFLIIKISSLRSWLQGTEGFGVPQRATNLLQERGDLQVLF